MIKESRQGNEVDSPLKSVGDHRADEIGVFPQETTCVARETAAGTSALGWGRKKELAI